MPGGDISACHGFFSILHYDSASSKRITSLVFSDFSTILIFVCFMPMARDEGVVPEEEQVWHGYTLF